MERGRQQGQDWRKQSIQGTGKSRCKGPGVGANVGQTGKRKDALRRLTHSVCGESQRSLVCQEARDEVGRGQLG